MQTIVYYISGHGYGHTTRSLELIRALMARNPQLFFHIRTDAPEWMIKLNLVSNYVLHCVWMDVGAVQTTSFEIDKLATHRQVSALYAQKDEIARREGAFVKAVTAQAIIADIPPLAFEVAEAAGIPGIALGNFSWDWIYGDYVGEIPEFAELIAKIRNSYSKASLLLRLPFYGNLSAFPNIKDIPLIARKASLPKAEVWRQLGIETENRPKLVLVAFRAGDLANVDFQKLETIADVKFITLGLGRTFDNTIDLPPNFIRFPELANACDAVISKPGYGLVAEVIANRVPLLYTSRDDFAEYDDLVLGLQQYAVAEFLPRENFASGNWEPYLRRLLERPVEWKEIAKNGADVAAEEILAILKKNSY
jgi:L-arabinokinase